MPHYFEVLAGIRLIASLLLILGLSRPMAAVESETVAEPVAAATTAENSTGESTDNAFWVRDLAEKVGKSIVLITVAGRDGRQDGLGSGFVLDAEGLIATNLHVIGEARPITVRFRDGRTYPVVEVFASDQHFDLAIVRIDARQLTPLPLVSATEPIPQGLPIVAFGNPMGFEHSIVSGVVSGNRDIDDRRMLQIAIPIEPGNSGGPVVIAPVRCWVS